jgi:hypothetical protein
VKSIIPFPYFQAAEHEVQELESDKEGIRVNLEELHTRLTTEGETPESRVAAGVEAVNFMLKTYYTGG